MKWIERAVLIAILCVALAGLWLPHTVVLPKDNVLILSPAECPHGITAIMGDIRPKDAPCHPNIPLPDIRIQKDPLRL